MLYADEKDTVYIAEFNGEKFLLAVPNDNSVVVLIVTPNSLSDDDGRCLKVVQSTDTHTEDVEYTVIFPEINDGEHGMWADAMQCAAVFMMGSEQEEDGSE